jgi:hypothetical protein
MGSEGKGREGKGRMIGGLTTRDSCRIKSGGIARLPRLRTGTRDDDDGSREGRGPSESMDLGRRDARRGQVVGWRCKREIFKGRNDKYSRAAARGRGAKAACASRVAWVIAGLALAGSEALAARLLRCDGDTDTERPVMTRHVSLGLTSAFPCGRPLPGMSFVVGLI